MNQIWIHLCNSHWLNLPELTWILNAKKLRVLCPINNYRNYAPLNMPCKTRKVLWIVFLFIHIKYILCSLCKMKIPNIVLIFVFTQIQWGFMKYLLCLYIIVRFFHANLVSKSTKCFIRSVLRSCFNSLWLRATRKKTCLILTVFLMCKSYI